MAGRRVAAGTLGCPSCGRVVSVRESGLDFGGDPPAPRPTVLSPEAVAAFLALEGPGGYLALFGTAGGAAAQLAMMLPGIRLVLVNPPTASTAATVEAASIIRAGRSPLKTGSMRGVVVSADHGADPSWVDAAIEAVLPGNRVVIEGPRSNRPDLEVLGDAGGVWVARRSTTSVR
jgi:hypothetical protein